MKERGRPAMKKLLSAAALALAACAFAAQGRRKKGATAIAVTP